MGRDIVISGPLPINCRKLRILLAQFMEMRPTSSAGSHGIKNLGIHNLVGQPQHKTEYKFPNPTQTKEVKLIILSRLALLVQRCFDSALAGEDQRACSPSGIAHLIACPRFQRLTAMEVGEEEPEEVKHEMDGRSPIFGEFFLGAVCNLSWATGLLLTGSSSADKALPTQSTKAQEVASVDDLLSYRRQRRDSC